MNLIIRRGFLLENVFVIFEWVKSLGLNILSIQSWFRVSYDFYFVLNIFGCGEINLCYLYELVLENKYSFVFVGYRVVQEVIFQYVVLELSGLIGFFFWGGFYCGIF